MVVGDIRNSNLWVHVLILLTQWIHGKVLSHDNGNTCNDVYSIKSSGCVEFTHLGCWRGAKIILHKVLIKESIVMYRNCSWVNFYFFFQTQQVQADAFFFVHSMPKFIFRWRIYVEMEKMKRENQEKCTQFRKYGQMLIPVYQSTWIVILQITFTWVVKKNVDSRSL